VPARITVYCRQALAGDDWLIRASNGPDYLVAAENAGLDEDAMEEATDALVVADNGDITYAGGTRPIQVARWRDREMIDAMLADARERLEDDLDVAAQLDATVEIVGFELGFEQAEGIGGVIAEEIAREIARETDGIVDFYGDEWRITEDGRELA
jgi:hypothetical protein